jgi:fatty-acyl-CoA synthase
MATIGSATNRLDTLIQNDRVHGSLYYDEGIFNQELERIWHRGWVFLGHESEVKKRGDYVRKQIGKEPVVMTRTAEGKVAVLYNRCPHRANQVCSEEKGNASVLRCPYHGWTFANDGKLVGMPYSEGYGPGLDRSQLGIVPVARVGLYRGFVWASLATEGRSLEEHLGNTRVYLDRVADLSPEGEIELPGQWLKHEGNMNWKMPYENEGDGYHPHFTHQSIFKSLHTPKAELFGEKNSSLIRYLGGGHTTLDTVPEYRQRNQKYYWFGAKDSSLPEYTRIMEEKYGPERARQMLIDGPGFGTMIFPNIFLAELAIILNVPVSATRTIQYFSPIYLKGAPEEVNRRSLRQFEGAFGPMGLIHGDDVVMYERNQRGLESGKPEYLYLGRGLHREHRAEDGTLYSNVTDETSNRGFWRFYKEVMSMA